MGLPRFNADDMQQGFELSYDHGAAAVDATVKIFQIPAGKTLKVDGVKYINPTGLAQDGTNYFTVKLLKGTTVAFSWSTLTGSQGSLAANTFVDLVISATAADAVFAAADVMSLFLDETGDTTLPAGRLVVYGRYV